MPNIGLSVIEGVANGVTPFVESNKYNVGLAIASIRGKSRVPTLVTSQQEANTRFGGTSTTMFGGYVLRNLFANAGQFGAVVYGLRILDEDNSTAARGTLTDGAPTNEALTLGVSTPGVAQISTLALSGTGGSFTFTINGTVYGSVDYATSLTVTGDDYVTAQAANILAAEGIIVTNVSGTLTFTANVAGAAFTISNITNTSGNLGGTIATPTANVAAIRTITPSNVHIGDTFTIATGSESVSFVATAPTVGNACAGLKAAIDAKVIASPTGDIAKTFLARVNNSTNVSFTGPQNTVTLSTASGSANSILTITAAQEGVEDLGDWANGLTVKVYPINDPAGVANNYLFEVYYKGSLAESWQAPTWASAITLINAQSLYIMLAPFASGSLVNDITDIQTVVLSGGVYTAPTEAMFHPSISAGSRYGLQCFDGQDIQIISCTEYQTLAMAQQGDTYCQNRGNSVYIAVLPYLSSITDVATFSAGLQKSGPSFSGSYNLWVKTDDGTGNGTFIWVPGLGQIIGAGYIRVPQLQNDSVWAPPAGVDSSFVDCVDIAPNNLSTNEINLCVQRYTTNVAVYAKGQGFFLMSSRTNASNPLYNSMHVRRLTDFLTDTLKSNLLWALQKPNTVDLRKSIVISLTQYMKGIYDNGGLETTVDFATACQVICDKTNNPASQDRKVLNVTVQYIPVECTESVVIKLNRNDGILIATALQQ